MPISLLHDGAAAPAKPPTAYRWEWRCFGLRFGRAEERLARLTSSSPQDSDEIYLMSSSGENVKVRDGLMDVKILRKTNLDGLEQWAPVMKEPFPLGAANVGTVLEALGCPLRLVSKDCDSLESFLATFAGPGSGIQAAQVHKRRVRYEIEGCMAELSDIRVDGRPTRTLAVESEDPVAVMRAVEALGLGDYVNVSYPRALEALLYSTAERYAVIDVGTNSVKFHVGERDLKGNWTTVADRAAVTRLGEGLAETGVIGDAAIDRTTSAIAKMVEEAKRAGVRAIAAVGTAGLRTAANSAEVVAAIRAATALKVEVISGEDEARLAYIATASALSPRQGTLVVFDTGGGSSQFTFGHGSTIDQRFSVAVGAARYTEAYGLDGAVSVEVVDQAMRAIADDLEKLENRTVPDLLVGMGGAVTNLAAVRHGLSTYDADLIQGTILEADEIDRQIELYRARDSDLRQLIVSPQANRAETILAGACVVRVIMQKLGKASFTVSDRGLRHGVLAEWFGS